MSAVLAKPQVKDFLKTLAKGKEKGQEQRKEHDVNAHAVTAEGEPSKKPWEEDIPELSSPSYSPPTSFSYSSDSSSSSNPRRRRKSTKRNQPKKEGITLCGSVHCLSTGQKRWPEDLTWHPSGNSIFACYGADAQDDQVSVINLSADVGEDKVKFLKEKPHEKGLINNLVFCPWKNGTFFTTAGCDHAVVVWKEREAGLWRAETLHRALHSSAVMSAVGMQHKPLIVSVGMDKRIIGFDTEHVREEFRHTLDNKALRMLPNPIDSNLYMVQTGTPGAQLRLFDVRSHSRELLAFGWRQDATESQSALVHPSWSHNGLYVASGSADPRIHLFDIRYKAKEPSQSIKAHQKRVFKAMWHHTLPLLISISSDLNVGLVKLNL
ncbi:hypothetical protein L7F22_029019 [Adiantum nelumboides]|nr:hypothetical protein [Adiantum nelumboides]